MTAISRLTSGRLGTAFLGLVFTVLVVGLSILGVAYGFGAFSTSTTVQASLPTAGPALSTGAEVQYRGVLVGTLGKLQRTESHALLTLDIEPSKLDQIPGNVTVRLVPRSVFGDLYVDLVPPTRSAGHLVGGVTLAADRSSSTVELDQALDAGYQLLTAVQPAKLDETLTAIATALNGRGAELGRLVTQVSTYTSEVAPHTGQLIHDVTTLGTVGRELSTDAPDLLHTLDDAIATSRTIAADQSTLSKVLNAGPGVADDTGQLLKDNRVKLVTLVHLLHPVVGVLGDHQPELVRTVQQLHDFLIGAASALGHGPFLQVKVHLDPSQAGGRAYTAADCPRYPGLSGANCPASSRSARAPSAEDAVQAIVDAAAGVDRTPRDNPTAIAALRQRLAIADVLLAPVLRSAGGLLQ